MRDGLGKVHSIGRDDPACAKIFYTYTFFRDARASSTVMAWILPLDAARRPRLTQKRKEEEWGSRIYVCGDVYIPAVARVSPAAKLEIYSHRNWSDWCRVRLPKRSSVCLSLSMAGET